MKINANASRPNHAHRKHTRTHARWFRLGCARAFFGRVASCGACTAAAIAAANQTAAHKSNHFSSVEPLSARRVAPRLARPPPPARTSQRQRTTLRHCLKLSILSAKKLAIWPSARRVYVRVGQRRELVARKTGAGAQQRRVLHLAHAEPPLLHATVGGAPRERVSYRSEMSTASVWIFL